MVAGQSEFVDEPRFGFIVNFYSGYRFTRFRYWMLYCRSFIDTTMHCLKCIVAEHTIYYHLYAIHMPSLHTTRCIPRTHLHTFSKDACDNLSTECVIVKSLCYSEPRFLWNSYNSDIHTFIRTVISVRQPHHVNTAVVITFNAHLHWSAPEWPTPVMSASVYIDVMGGPDDVNRFR